MRRVKTRAPRGVTLMEMMVVVAIAGVVAAIAVPNLSPMVKAERLKGKAEQAAALVDRARRLAYATGRCHAIDVVARQLVLQENTGTDAANCVDMASPTWTTIGRVDPEGIGLSFIIEASDTPIVMRPNNRLRGDGDQDTLDDRARIRVHHARLDAGWIVKITPFGRVCKEQYWPGSVPPTATPETCR